MFSTKLKSESVQLSNFDVFPDEIKLMIFSFLDMKSLGNLSLCSLTMLGLCSEAKNKTVEGLAYSLTKELYKADDHNRNTRRGFHVGEHVNKILKPIESAIYNGFFIKQRPYKEKTIHYGSFIATEHVKNKKFHVDSVEEIANRIRILKNDINDIVSGRYANHHNDGTIENAAMNTEMILDEVTINMLLGHKNDFCLIYLNIIPNTDQNIDMMNRLTLMSRLQIELNNADPIQHKDYIKTLNTMLVIILNNIKNAGRQYLDVFYQFTHTLLLAIKQVNENSPAICYYDKPYNLFTQIDKFLFEARHNQFALTSTDTDVTSQNQIYCALRP
jgi:hypothetical protein